MLGLHRDADAQAAAPGLRVERVDAEVEEHLEEPIVAMEKPDLWGGTVTLANGWRLLLPALAAETTLPLTVDARRMDDA